MLKNIFLVVCVLFVNPLQANDSWFVAAKLGKASPTQSYQEINFNAVKFDFDGGYDYTLSAGKDFEKFSVELEYSVRDFDANSRIIITTGDMEQMDGHQNQTSIFINGYMHQPIGEKISLFMGVGIGKTNVQWRGVTTTSFPAIINSEETVDAYKTVLGAELALTEVLSLNLSYQYVVMDDLVLTLLGSAAGKFDNQDVKVFNTAIKYRF